MNDLVEDKLRDHYRAVGALANSWALLELRVNAAIWETMNVEGEVGACLTSQLMSIGPRMQALTALLKLRGITQSMVRKFGKLSDQMGGLARRRNRIVHDVRGTSSVSGLSHRIEITAFNKLIFGPTPEQPTDIEVLSCEIELTLGRFESLWGKMKAEQRLWTNDRYMRSGWIIGKDTKGLAAET